MDMPADLDNLEGERDTLSSELLEFAFEFEIDSEIPINSQFSSNNPLNVKCFRVLNFGILSAN